MAAKRFHNSTMLFDPAGIVGSSYHSSNKKFGNAILTVNMAKTTNWMTYKMSESPRDSHP